MRSSAACTGLGSQLHVYPLLKGLCQQTSVTVFQDGTKIHCIHGSPADQGALLAVCGGRIAKVTSNCVESMYFEDF